jgi:hypothetical protein
MIAIKRRISGMLLFCQQLADAQVESVFRSFVETINRQPRPK